jgi:iron only hydrogenase large subunit-like protein
VKSIRFTDGQAEIMGEACIACGACLSACPQHAKQVVSKLDEIKALVGQTRVVLSLAPSFLVSFCPGHPMKMVSALKKLGFYQVQETARGAALISDDLVRIANRGDRKNIITTCCPAATDLVEKHYPQLIDALAPIVSPMLAHARMIKSELDQDIPVVFAGPCIAKINEAQDIRHNNDVFGVLTFAELAQWLQEAGIDPEVMEEAPFDGSDPGMARLYPTHAGILDNVRARGIRGYSLLQVTGAESCMQILNAIDRGQLDKCFIEMSVCPGSCVGGPVSGRPREARFTGEIAVRQYTAADPTVAVLPQGDINLKKTYVDRSVNQPLPTEEELRVILRSIGKETKEDELNCGSCGFASCRDKAIAVFQGRAELSMCMPYMYQAAQSMAGVVLDNTPNLILVADENLRICEINTAAQRVLHISRAEALNHYLQEFLDPSDFEYVLASKQTIVDKKVFWEEYHISTEQTLVYLPKQPGVMGIIRDVSAESQRMEHLYKLRVDTMEMAQKVIDKQMVAAQEIASLLGETTAETKVTLTRLKNMVLSDGDERHDAR